MKPKSANGACESLTTVKINICKCEKSVGKRERKSVRKLCT